MLYDSRHGTVARPRTTRSVPSSTAPPDGSGVDEIFRAGGDGRRRRRGRSPVAAERRGRRDRSEPPEPVARPSGRARVRGRVARRDRVEDRLEQPGFFTVASRALSVICGSPSKRNHRVRFYITFTPFGSIWSRA